MAPAPLKRGVGLEYKGRFWLLLCDTAYFEICSTINLVLMCTIFVLIAARLRHPPGSFFCVSDLASLVPWIVSLVIFFIAQIVNTGISVTVDIKKLYTTGLSVLF